MTSLGLYIHIPFCRSRCDYCGFYSIGRKPTDRYIDALTKEMDLKSPDFEDRLCDTVYLGGRHTLFALRSAAHKTDEDALSAFPYF